MGALWKLPRSIYALAKNNGLFPSTPKPTEIAGRLDHARR